MRRRRRDVRPMLAVVAIASLAGAWLLQLLPEPAPPEPSPAAQTAPLPRVVTPEGVAGPSAPAVAALPRVVTPDPAPRLPPPRPLAGGLAGLAQVQDGDSLILAGQRLRLDAVDAPELGQWCDGPQGRWPCGRAAAEALAGLLEGREIACRDHGTDRYGRTLAQCWLGGQDIGAWLVRQGWAVAYVRVSDRYLPEEAEARAARRGLWAGRFETPEEWRQRHAR